MYSFRVYSFLILLLSLVSNSHATDFCTRTNDEITSLLLDPANRIGFENEGGLFNGGVCWWHSRLQRSAVYLTQFKPEQPKPSAAQLDQILNSLRLMDQVVVIPGFRDFQTFSLYYQKQVQKTLDHWQRLDGFLNQQWIRGISGKSSLPPEELKTQMNRVYEFYLRSPTPIWVMAQIKGVVAHAYLVTQMIPTEEGYQLRLIDSNRPLESRYTEYKIGDRYLTTGSFHFVPYVGFQKDLKKLVLAIEDHCKSSYINVNEIPEGLFDRRQ